MRGASAQTALSRVVAAAAVCRRAREAAEAKAAVATVGDGRSRDEEGSAVT
jgi:hypothetical protein